jgi:hypothetical protein
LFASIIYICFTPNQRQHVLETKKNIRKGCLISATERTKRRQSWKPPMEDVEAKAEGSKV